MKCYSKPGCAAAVGVGEAAAFFFFFSLIRIDSRFLEFSRRLGLIVNRYFISNRAAAEQRSPSTMKPVSPCEASYEALSIRLRGSSRHQIASLRPFDAVDPAVRVDSTRTHHRPALCHLVRACLSLAVYTSSFVRANKSSHDCSFLSVLVRMSQTGVNPLRFWGSVRGQRWTIMISFLQGR